MFKHKCEMCGLEFETNNTRAKYCIYCRDKAQAARNRAYAEKKKSGSAVKIGSEQICPICGKTYTVTSGPLSELLQGVYRRQEAKKVSSEHEVPQRALRLYPCQRPKGRA